MPQCQFLFSAIFVFQKSCTENILGIARDKLPVPYNHVTKTVPEDDLRGASQVNRPHPGAARAWPASGWRLGPPGRLRLASSPIYSLFRENPRGTRENPRKVLRPPSSPKKDSGTEVSVPTPFRDGEVPTEPSPSTPPPSSSPLLSLLMRRE